MAGHVTELLAAIDRADVRRVAALFDGPYPPDALASILRAACLGRSYDVLYCLLDKISVQAFLSAAPTATLHSLLNAAAQGGDLHIMAGMSRATGVAWRDVAEDTGGVELLTPLLIAAIRGDTDAMHFLLEDGVDPNAGRTRDGNGPLAMAAAHGFTGAAAMLLDAGATIDARNGGGATATDLALLYGHDEIVQLCHMAHSRALASVDGNAIKSSISKLRQAKQYTNYAVREREKVDFGRVQQKISKLKARIHGRIDAN
ncbi:hypothetical protein SPRG_02725 [Saprolegnia parasitica CBS 223.65]|uniref:Uncharacterized protein n=1 Tax=Saprolegnia parasitica (strain CBS 223.65) TaxID=695850 RepID=A0A067D0H0_SAPPC|nr:hypothetical protein SPRG_02725 [Saprolegnia parasitica CBS 223.65]KDO32246.1 hypothetical protein SPRG_02725 [Saprolegnia parasitica CBS 223.65]|eukprot:XP_012196704.1 hypothetical protein SPRG_02725 [Saprolegnia parasitica CBS 223.65]